MSTRVPYGLVSDTHNHPWTQFAITLPDGINSRLQTILDETYRAAQAVKALGGKHLFHAGDLFHVRGEIKPSVLNPTKDLYKKLVAEGFEVIILAGNHDLEGKESTRIGSAVTALEDVGCTIINEPTIIELAPTHHVCMMPWVNKLEELKAQIERIAARAAAGTGTASGFDVDLILHAPVDGVIAGLPDHGLTAPWLASHGFSKVLSGHYHNHKALGDEVFSIGALTHHTWGDIGSKAGFVTIDDGGKVIYNASHAPQFIELDSSIDPDEIPLIVPGNFVRCKINSHSAVDAEHVRQMLQDNGAAGITVLPNVTAPVTTRSGATVKSGETIEGSVAAYVEAGEFEDKPALQSLCADILSTAKSKAV